MRRLLTIMALLPLLCLQAQADNINLKDLCQGAYSAKRIHGVKPLADGERYAQMSSDRRKIITYSFKTGEQAGVLFDADNIKGRLRIDHIDGYILSPDESRILLQTQTTPIYRHSFTAEYYIYDVKSRNLAVLSTGGPQEVPLWSPDGNMVAFVREGNLFLVKLLFNNSESQVTTDGKFNEVINGKPDWVNEEEFSFSRAFDFNADATMLAWIRYDESKVPEYAFPLYYGMDESKAQYADYPGRYSYKYPVAGQQNSTVKVQSFDIKSRKIRDMQLPLDPDGYIPRIQFTDHPEKLLVLTQNRHQNQLDIYIANPRSTECRCIVRDHAERYINENPYKNLRLLPGSFVLMSARSGYDHLYLYDFNGTLKRQLTKGDYVVTDFYGYDPKTGTTYYAANQEAPMRKAVYSCDAKGKVVKLSTQQGTNDAIFSTTFKYFMNVYSNLDTPPVTTLCDAKGRTLKTLEDNADLRQKLARITLGQRKLITVPTDGGVQLNAIMVLPPDFKESSQYPVVMYQYSGPGSQQVLDSWSAGNMGGMLYERYLAQKGFICVIVDGRGTGGRGREFEQCTYLKLGQLESHDQAQAALYLGTLPYVDKARIGIWGWSFGGFNTLMSMSEGRGVFAAGVAVAPPTSWKYYDTVYTERFMRTPNENKEGYDVSPIGRASGLQGHLLLCHGLADDNVHWRNTAEYTEALVQADKDFKELTYTNKNHGIYGGNTRYHLFRQITGWFQDYLQ